MEDAIKLAEVDQRSKSNSHRIDALEKRQDNLDELVQSVAVMANEQEHIKTDVGVIKSDVKSLTEKPVKLWENLVEKLLWLIVGGVAAYFLSKIGI